MLDSHCLQIERAEIQNKLNNDRLIEIRSTDADAEERKNERKAFTEEMNGVNERLIVALQKEDIETQAVTAKHVDMASDIWTPELRELRTIAQKAEFRHYVASSISETPLQGEAREYNEQMLVSWAPGEFPIEKLLDPVEDFKPSELIGYKVADKSVEERAAIGGTFSNVGTVTWASRLFQSSEALYMGAQMPVVGTGRQDYPIIAGTDVGSTYAAGAAETAGGSITIVTARPERLQKTYEYDMVNELEIPGIANALAPDLRGGLMEANDLKVVTDLLAGVGTVTPAVSTTIETLSNFLSRFGLVVDGRVAYDVRDVKALVGTQLDMNDSSYVTLSASSIANIAQWFTMPDDFHARVRGSAHIPAPDNSSKDQFVLFYGNRGPGRLINPIWRRGVLLRDTGRKQLENQVTLTGVMFVDVILVNTDPYRKGSINTA